MIVKKVDKTGLNATVTIQLEARELVNLMQIVAFIEPYDTPVGVSPDEMTQLYIELHDAVKLMHAAPRLFIKW